MGNAIRVDFVDGITFYMKRIAIKDLPHKKTKLFSFN